MMNKPTNSREFYAAKKVSSDQLPKEAKQKSLFSSSKDVDIDSWFNDNGGVSAHGKATTTGGGKPKPYKPCYQTHKPLPLGNGLVVYGGSCSTPVISDADVYVGFDHSFERTSRGYPWTPGHEVNFLIPDMKAPASPTDFAKLVEWVALMVSTGSKVHCGCIGGHGRTGTMLSALVCVMTGEKDAIKYVRREYCPKAVESEAQVNFLTKHFGIVAAKPAKHFSADSPAKGSSGNWVKDFSKGGGGNGYTTSNNRNWPATRAAFCAWGPNAVTKKT